MVQLVVAFRQFALIGGSVLAMIGATPASAAAGIPCNRERVAGIVRDQNRNLADAERNMGGISSLRCFDFTGDGTRDVLFSVFGGGTAGNGAWGLVVADGGTHKLTNYGGGGSDLGIDRRGSRPQVINPIYRRGDPNCCPTGGFRIRTYKWNGRRLRLESTRRTGSAPKRFYRRMHYNGTGQSARS
jgi:hypothetical protein